MGDNIYKTLRQNRDLSAGGDMKAVDYDPAGKVDQVLCDSDKAVANGVATLDAGAKIPIAQIPDTVVGAVDYKGTWNANTNSPDLPAATPDKGDYYVVSADGTTSLGGITDWSIGDWAIYNGTAWEKLDNSSVQTNIENVFTKEQTITIADTTNSEALTINQNDTTNNPTAIIINNTGSGDTININSGEFKVEGDGTLSVSGVSDYETLVVDDDDVPNKKYVVDFINTPQIDSGQTIYLSPTGNDSTGDGTSGNRYFSIHRALQDVNEYIEGSVTIRLAAGTYDYSALNDLIIDKKFTDSTSLIRIVYDYTTNINEAFVSLGGPITGNMNTNGDFDHVDTAAPFGANNSLVGKWIHVTSYNSGIPESSDSLSNLNICPIISNTSDTITVPMYANTNFNAYEIKELQTTINFGSKNIVFGSKSCARLMINGVEIICDEIVNVNTGNKPVSVNKIEPTNSSVVVSGLCGVPTSTSAGYLETTGSGGFAGLSYIYKSVLNADGNDYGNYTDIISGYIEKSVFGTTVGSSERVPLWIQKNSAPMIIDCKFVNCFAGIYLDPDCGVLYYGDVEFASTSYFIVGETHSYCVVGYESYGYSINFNNEPASGRLTLDFGVSAADNYVDPIKKINFAAIAPTDAKKIPYVGDITDYETLVTDDDHIPNKKYVDDGLDDKAELTTNTFSGEQTITIADSTNSEALTINQNDTTNNPDALVISNTGTGSEIVVNTSEFVVKDAKVGINNNAPDALLHVGSEYTTTGSLNPVAVIGVDANSIQTLQLENTNTGTTAEMRFICKSDDGDYIAFTQPSSICTGTIFGKNRTDSSFIFNLGRDLVIGTFNANDMHFGTNNVTRMSVDSSGEIQILNGGSSTNSNKLSLIGNNSGTLQTGTLQCVYGANPYIRFSPPNAAGSATATLDMRSDLLSFSSDNAVDIGASGSGRPKDIYTAGNINVGSVLKLGQFTHTEAGALTPANGDVIYVTSTDATFTSVGVWAYENSSWVKL